jgi:hypothetical protein
MKLTVSCQTCGKVLAVIDKDQVTSDDVNMYEQSSSCDTIASESFDENGNPIIVYDGNSNIQATMTVS